MLLQQVLAGIVVGLCAWAILSPHVPTGTVITLGLGLIALGCLPAFDDRASSFKALTTLLAGVLVVASGMLWRGRQARRRDTARNGPRRRATDFGAI